MIFQIPEDIANRALQHLGAVRITAFSDNSKNAAEASFIYDKCRRAELRANLWNCSARRLVLRPYQPGVSVVWEPFAWSATPNYPSGSIVSFNGMNWSTTLSSNTNTTPGVGSPYLGWAEFFQPVFTQPYVAGTYYGGELVQFNNSFYAALKTTAQSPGQITDWQQVSNSTTAITFFNSQLFLPGGVTTNTLTTPKPAYPLPNGYMRVMPQDPKSPATPAQLSTAGMQTSDYEFENGFLYTSSTQGGPVVFRFAADIRNVLQFDDLLAEALACRIALELNETITQSPQKAQILNGLYEEAIAKATRINAIEAGSTEPDQDKVAGNRGPTRERIVQPPQPRQQ